MYDEKHDVDHEVQMLLQEAGLESVPIDPISLDALKSIVATGGGGSGCGFSNQSKENTFVPATAGAAAEESSTVKAHFHDCHPAPHHHDESCPPMSEIIQHPKQMKRLTSELTSTPSADSLADTNTNNNTDGRREDSSLAALVEARTPFVKVEGATPVENKILEQLHRQTRLLLEMQRRIDELTSTVENLTRAGAGGVIVGGSPVVIQHPLGVQVPVVVGPTTGGKAAIRSAAPRTTTTAGVGWRPITPPPPPPPHHHQQQQPHQVPQTFATGGAVLPPQPLVAPAGQVAPRQQQQQQQQQPPQQQRQPQGGLLMAIRNSPIFKIMYLFWKLRRRHVQELDGGLIFKILFMMAILTARMSSGSMKGGSSGSSKHGDPDWHHKFAVLVVLVFTGFLIQTGYMQYLYTFFVKENYPERVFNGEEVDDILRNPHNNNNNDNGVGGGRNNNNNNNDPNNPQNNNQGPRPPGAPPLPRGQQAPGGGGGLGGWRNTFLGGIIPQADQGGVARVVQDIALLLGSFLMSILPMWHPEGPPQQQQHRRAPLQGAAGGGGGRGQAPPPPPGGLAAGPGAVRPPRDVLQPADDSDDEDGN